MNSYHFNSYFKILVPKSDNFGFSAWASSGGTRRRTQIQMHLWERSVHGKSTRCICHIFIVMLLRIFFFKKNKRYDDERFGKGVLFQAGGM